MTLDLVRGYWQSDAQFMDMLDKAQAARKESGLDPIGEEEISGAWDEAQNRLAANEDAKKVTAAFDALEADIKELATKHNVAILAACRLKDHGAVTRISEGSDGLVEHLGLLKFLELKEKSL